MIIETALSHHEYLAQLRPLALSDKFLRCIQNYFNLIIFKISASI